MLYFNPQNGVYLSQAQELHSDWHSHPALEVLINTEGGMDLETRKQSLSMVQGLMIAPNVEHRIRKTDGTTHVFLLEIAKPGAVLDPVILDKGITELPSESEWTRWELLPKRFQDNDPLAFDDARVALACKIVSQEFVNTQQCMDRIRREIPLSESRLAHLFKHQMGISMRQYIQWVKLKHAIHQHLKSGQALMHCAFEHGFYDQAHFIKVYKKFIGMAPAGTYKSRIVQFLEGPMA